MPKVRYHDGPVTRKQRSKMFDEDLERVQQEYNAHHNPTKIPLLWSDWITDRMAHKYGSVYTFLRQFFG